ncbi:MAG: PIG-L family deacetylase [Planctomycetota bacterium]
MILRTTRPALLSPVLLLAIFLFAVFACLWSGAADAQRVLAPPTDRARELALLLRTLDETGRVLYVTAHPDDEDARLLARLRHKQGIETALLTLTRGEGGQNEIGPELFDALGVLRSRELEAAGQYTGVQQYFSTARDFGYSFSTEETYEKWHRQSVLREIVRHIRAFRPDVLLTMLTDPEGGGQHHQASAALAIEAFEIAATQQFPSLGEPHRASRLFRQVWDDRELPNICEVPLNEYDAVLGCTYLELGRESRAQHKCQGMARLGAPRGLHSRWQWLRGGKEAPADDLLAGLGDLLRDERQPGSIRSSALQLAAAPRATYRLEDPGASLPALLQLWSHIAAVHPEPGYPDAGHPDAGHPDWDRTRRARLSTLRNRCARAIQLAAGLHVEAESAQRWLAPDAPWTIQLRGWTTETPCSLQCQVLVRTPDGKLSPLGDRVALDVKRDAVATDTITVTTPSFSTLTRATPARVNDLDEQLRWQRYATPQWQSFWISVTADIAGVVQLPLIPVECREVTAELPTIFRSDPQVVPDPALTVHRSVLPVRVDATAGTPIEVQVSSIAGGKVEVEAGIVTSAGRSVAPGWRVEPQRQVVTTVAGGLPTVARFRVFPQLYEEPVAPGTAQGPATRTRTRDPLPSRLSFVARRVGTVDWSSSGYRAVEYPHIRPGALLTEPRVELRALRCVVPQRRVGFVVGAGGDEMPWALAVLGITPTMLSRQDLEEGDLSRFDVIVTGVRAYKVRPGLRSGHARLQKWMQQGGTLVVQYNKFEWNGGKELSPYGPFPGAAVSRRRVTVEEAAVDVLLPQHPFLTTPNRILPDDWSGWVQERGLYFLDAPSPPYQDLLAIADPWPNNPGRHLGSLVVADVAAGRWVYVGVALFRQLAAGVPGGYRLLANLLAPNS